eukprot:TRINITY_DN7118_c0_g1_i1.p1 TRINITY_DN7118_c0_g1~~TRINITY_DN7118_c0_g1_i1.p1  ORF type:complete len:456 (-),score=102.66 TRINITY_DN7118_c0_g1_i1:63-1379(-)
MGGHLSRMDKTSAAAFAGSVASTAGCTLVLVLFVADLVVTGVRNHHIAETSRAAIVEVAQGEDAPTDNAEEPATVVVPTKDEEKAKKGEKEKEGGVNAASDDEPAGEGKTKRQQRVDNLRAFLQHTHLNQFHIRILLNLMITNLLWSITNMSQNSRLLHKLIYNEPLPFTKAGCAVAGPVLMWFLLSSVFWIDALMLYMVSKLVFRITVNKHWFYHEWQFLLVCYGVPLIVALIPFATGGYAFEPGWCTPRNEDIHGEQISWIISICLTDIITTLCTVVLLYFLLRKRRPPRLMYMSKDRDEDPTAWRRKAASLLWDLLPFPIVFVVVTSFCLAEAGMKLGGPLWFEVIHMMAFAAAPFCFSILYGRVTQRELLKRLFGPPFSACRKHCCSCCTCCETRDQRALRRSSSARSIGLDSPPSSPLSVPEPDTEAPPPTGV